MTNAPAQPSIPEQVSARLLEVRNARLVDPTAGAALAAYYLRRSEILAEPLRSHAIDALERELAKASREDRRDGERYARLRVRLTTLAEELATERPRITPERAAAIRESAARQQRWLQGAFVAAVVGGPLALVAGLAIGGRVGPALVMLGGGALYGAYRASPFLSMARSSELATHASALESGTGEDEHAALARERDALVEGEDGTWARALVQAHPLLAFPHLDARAAEPAAE